MHGNNRTLIRQNWTEHSYFTSSQLDFTCHINAIFDKKKKRIPSNIISIANKIPPVRHIKSRPVSSSPHYLYQNIVRHNNTRFNTLSSCLNANFVIWQLLHFIIFNFRSHPSILPYRCTISRSTHSNSGTQPFVIDITIIEAP